MSARSLQDRLDSSAEAWKPNVDDSVIGTVLAVDERTTEFGTYPIVTLMTDDGDEVAVHAFHTVLKSEFARRPPVDGERLGIKYLGKSPKGYEAYRVVWENTRPPNWDRIGAEAQAERIVAEAETAQPTEASGAPDDDIPF